jgi:ankyrin repeat protein
MRAVVVVTIGLTAAGLALAACAEPDGAAAPVTAPPSLSGFSPLASAAAGDDVATVRKLLAAGADLDAAGPEGLRAWHVAAQTDAALALAVLHDAGADLDVRSTNGMDTLDHAAATGSLAVIAYLAPTPAELDARSEVVTQGHGVPADRGPTALAIATRAGQIEVVAALLAAGADVDARSTNGQTALFAAVVSDQPPEMVSMLLAAGADPSVTVECIERCNEHPGDALDWARRLDRDELVPLLE